MADPRFFAKSAPKKISEIIEISGAEFSGDYDASLMIDDVAALDVATASDISFFDNRKYLEQFKATKAGACFVSADMVEHAPEGLICLTSFQAYKAYALTAQAFYPDESVDEAVIEAGAIVHDTAEIGKGSIIEAGAVIGAGVQIGEHCRIGSNAVVSHAVIGNHVHVYRGAMIGQDGFGFAIDPTGFVKVPQLGRVVIDDGVQIGANATIDRGAGPDTVIGQGSWIDNLVQVGHNVQIGKMCVIVAQVGISGSTVIEDFVQLGGQAGIAGHLTIGSGARIAAQSGIMRDVEAGAELMGSPAVPMKQFMRQITALKRLIKPSKSS